MQAAAAPKELPLLYRERLDAGEDCFTLGLPESSRLSELESLFHQPLRLFDESRTLPVKRAVPPDRPIIERC